jgi:hypothetical protein
MILVITLFFASFVYSKDDNNYNFTISQLGGIMYGQSEELVLKNKNDRYYSDIVSLLVWNIKPIFFIGYNLEFGPDIFLNKQGFYFQTSGKFGFPYISGKFIDKDWASHENAKLTHYSEHKNLTEKSIFIESSFGYNFIITNIFYLKPKINFSYMFLEFSGLDGWGKYANKVSTGIYDDINADNAADKEYSGKVITYNQNWYIFSFGFLFGIKMADKILLDLSFDITPLIYCQAEDQHLFPGNQNHILDKLLFGIYLEPKLNITFNLNKFLNLSLYGTYKFIQGTKGQSYFKPLNSTMDFIPNGKSGANLYLLDAGLSVSIIVY